MKTIIAAACASVALVTACATAAETQGAAEAPVTYRVIQADAEIPFAGQTVQGFEVGEDRSLILRAGVNRYYRATLWEPCARELRWREAIALGPLPTGKLDRFSSVSVAGYTCPIRTLDEIAPPGEAAAPTPAAPPAG